MLKEHSQKLREALLAANKAKDLEKAKKVVAEAVSFVLVLFCKGCGLF